MPTLYLFAISHFCEKGRWGLDYFGIDYDLKHLAPGAHMRWSKRVGLPESTLPALYTGETYIQGSGKIIDWAEQHSPSSTVLTPDQCAKECREIEQRCDDMIGVHTRRMFYSEALISQPDTVKSVFMNDLSGPQKIATRAIWPVLRKMMISRMDIGTEQGKESQQLLETELDWLDTLYADGRRFLCGDQFTRADLTVSALLARIAGAGEHPAAHLMSPLPGLASTIERWQKRPTMEHIRQNYREFRFPASGQ